MGSLSPVFTYLFILTALFTGCKRPIANREMGEQVLNQHWYLSSSKTVGETLEEVQGQLEQLDLWQPAQVPGTVLGSLVEAGIYPDPFVGTRMDSIPRTDFEVPWWYKTSFTLANLTQQEQLTLLLDGINYRADIWLNGQLISNKDRIYGAFRQFAFPITQAAKEGENTLLVKIYPPQVRDFYMGFVDWAPTPADHFMGIFREIRLKRSGSVLIQDAFVKSDFNTADTASATLTTQISLKNNSEQEQQITLSVQVADQELQQPLLLKPFEQKEIQLDTTAFPQLRIKKPKLWWPNGLGDPALYRAKFYLYDQNKQLLDSTSRTFGIRKIETYLSKTGVRHYKINGREILIKAAGWVDDLFLRYQPEKDLAQIQYVQDMHLNALRLEGIWGNNQHLYDLCDQHGILVMLGWSCQWEWPDYLGLPLNMKPGDENLPINEGVERYAVKLEPQEKTLLSTYFRDQVKWLRNHPSIFTWVGGSDAVPSPDLEQRYLDTLAKYDPTRPFLISAGEFTSQLTGKSGMKMNGPYQYVPPLYWYEDKKLGGAYGFNSEVGPGPQIPPLKSIEKMIPESARWPADNAIWNYHSGRKDFATLSVYMEALNKRYGTSKNLADLAFRAQLLNYEAMRPMFEAHIVNHTQASGVVQWMLNSPWPEFYWQLYDYYLMPNGAYFGTKKALEPIHPIYNYHDQHIYVSNSTSYPIKHHKLIIKRYDLKSQLISQQELPLQLGANEVRSLVKIPEVTSQQRMTFLSLSVFNTENQVIGDNFYWLSSKMDQLDWETYSWFYTPTKQFADFTPLSSLPKSTLSLSKENLSENKGYQVWKIHCINNSNTISFFNELQLLDEQLQDNILPVIWSDNYFSLLPRESKTIEVRFPVGKKARIQLQSMNGKTAYF